MPYNARCNKWHLNLIPVCGSIIPDWLKTTPEFTKYEVDLAEQLNRASSRFASSATKHYESLSAFASTTLVNFRVM